MKYNFKKIVGSFLIILGLWILYLAFNNTPASFDEVVGLAYRIYLLNNVSIIVGVGFILQGVLNLIEK
jgi:hypothetical protein|tara:strand:- start:86 stop:289 length:204 start_codon:yes stop_codon:yes gene_type:complete